MGSEIKSLEVNKENLVKELGLSPEMAELILGAGTGAGEDVEAGADNSELPETKPVAHDLGHEAISAAGAEIDPFDPFDPFASQEEDPGMAMNRIETDAILATPPGMRLDLASLHDPNRADPRPVYLPIEQ